MDQPSKRRINVRTIIYRDDKLLAVRHKTSGGEAADYYAVPGGGLDPHESLTAGAAREIMEETGIAAKIGKLLFIQQFVSERKGYDEELEFFFAVDNPEDFTDIDLSKTTHGADEIAVIEYVDPLAVALLPRFLRSVDIGEAIANDHPTEIFDNFNETLD